MTKMDAMRPFLSLYMCIIDIKLVKNKVGIYAIQRKIIRIAIFS